MVIIKIMVVIIMIMVVIIMIRIVVRVWWPICRFKSWVRNPW